MSNTIIPRGTSAATSASLSPSAATFREHSERAAHQSNIYGQDHISGAIADGKNIVDVYPGKWAEEAEKSSRRTVFPLPDLPHLGRREQIFYQALKKDIPGTKRMVKDFKNHNYKMLQMQEFSHKINAALQAAKSPWKITYKSKRYPRGPGGMEFSLDVILGKDLYRTLP